MRCACCRATSLEQGKTRPSDTLDYETGDVSIWSTLLAAIPNVSCRGSHYVQASITCRLLQQLPSLRSTHACSQAQSSLIPHTIQVESTVLKAMCVCRCGTLAPTLVTLFWAWSPQAAHI